MSTFLPRRLFSSNNPRQLLDHDCLVARKLILRAFLTRIEWVAQWVDERLGLFPRHSARGMAVKYRLVPRGQHGSESGKEVRPVSEEVTEPIHKNLHGGIDVCGPQCPVFKKRLELHRGIFPQ